VNGYGYEQFKIGVILKKAREEAGLTQEELAKKLNTKKISYFKNRESCRGYKAFNLGEIC
jgi:ribosome-binding protein aMBF1 (putative translation factor)